MDSGSVQSQALPDGRHGLERNGRPVLSTGASLLQPFVPEVGKQGFGEFGHFGKTDEERQLRGGALTGDIKRCNV